VNEEFRSPVKPNSGRFRKGRSGNPRGRPSSFRALEASAFDVVLEKTVTTSDHGGTKQIAVEKALQQRTYRDALAGKRPAMREVAKWIVKDEAWLAKHAPKAAPSKITQHVAPDPDNADAALILLGIAAPNPERADIGADRARLLLEPWAVEAAVRRRRGGERLNDKERDDIRRCTRDPDNLRWPRATNT
jgi:hypothetical protein